MTIQQRYEKTNRFVVYRYISHDFNIILLLYIRGCYETSHKNAWEGLTKGKEDVEIWLKNNNK